MYMYNFIKNTTGKHNGFMISAIDSRLRGAGLSLGQGIVIICS